MSRFFLSCMLLLAFSSFAQQRTGNSFQFRIGGKTVRIQWVSPAVFRFTETSTASFAPDENLMVTRYEFAVVKVKSIETAMHYVLQTDSLRIVLNKKKFRLSVYDSRGILLNRDATISSLQAAQSQETVGAVKELQQGEHFFGLGERMDFVDQLYKKVKLNVGRGKGLPHEVGAYNILEASYAPIPLLLSTRGYGIFFHNAYPSVWDLGNSNPSQYSFAATGGELDYYFVYGPDFAHVLFGYTSLTGRAPLLSKAAHGLHVGTYSGGTWGHEEQTSDAYVLALARKLRELGINVDLLWLDSTWRIFGKVGGKGATSFEWRTTFKNPRAMFDSLYAMKYSMVGLHLRPRFDNGEKLKLLDTAQLLGFTYPEKEYAGEFVNFFDSNAVNWWWNHGVMRVASLGARFLKTDEGSAFGGLANESEKTGPSGKEIPAMHNLFPLAYAKAPFEKFQQLNATRGLNHTREGYAGIQRYPFIFAGDWPSEWQYFAPVIKAGINLGMSGVGYWGHCMGGFEHNADPELYMRWCQFGMFSPIAMLFGMDHPGYKEPWNYGEAAYLNFKKYDSLRYSLLPYIYTAAYKQYTTGRPLMQSMVLNHQYDPNVYDIGDQYYFGAQLLVCPVTVKSAKTRTVYLPEGDWFDFWTGKTWKGKQYIHVVTPPDTMPVFVKAGSLIPQQEALHFTGEKKLETLQWQVWPGEGSGAWYDDDGTSLNYQKGGHCFYQLNQLWDKNKGSILINPVITQFNSEVKTFEFLIPSSNLPETVLVNGNQLKALPTADSQGMEGYSFDSVTKKIKIKINRPFKETTITIQFSSF